MSELDELFEKIDNSLENVNYESNRDKSFRRFCYTWNNPFFNDEFVEVDINNTNLVLDLEHYDLHNLKSDFNKDFFDFKFIEYEDYKTGEKKVIERPFFKNVDCIRNYLIGFSTFRYSIFQIEKGGNCQTTHIQGFIQFKSPMTWSTFKNNFPCCHFNKCMSTSANCRTYCSKEDTRVDGPFEDGDFVEERTRTDVKEFLGLLKTGTTDNELLELFPSLYLREFNKIDKIRNRSVFEPFKTKYRDVEVIYLYGPPRCGKTRYVNQQYGYGNFYSVDEYKRGPFDNYNGEDVIVFDEFESQLDISLMNRLIDGHPVQLPCRFENKWACYTKVYIISNSPLSEQYIGNFVKDVQREAFISRIHKILRMDKSGNLNIEFNKTDSYLVPVFNLLDIFE